LEVAHAASKTQGGAPPEGEQKASIEEPPTTPPRAEPSVSSTPISDWQARYREGKYSESLALVRSSGFDKRLNELSPGVLAELADTARLGGDPGLAARALSTLVRRFPGSAEARDGKFLLGRVHALRGDRTAAIAAFEGYLSKGASALYANEAVGRLMELYSANGDAERARAMAERYLERAPNGPYQRLARSLVSQRK
jgi:TolA-binding protein